MSKEQQPTEIPYSQERRKNIGRLLHEISRLPIVVKQLGKVEEDSHGQTACLARPQVGLDLAFVNKIRKRGDDEKDRQAQEYVGIEIFGKKRCIGVAVCSDGEIVERGREILGSQVMVNLRRMGAEVAIIGESDLPRWLEFYRQVDSMGLTKKIRRRALDISGLEGMTSSETDLLFSQLQVIFQENKDYFAEKGVIRIEPRGGFDFAFIGADGGLVAVPLYHVRRMAGMEGEILLETVDEKPALCPGIVLRDEGENKRGAYREIRNLERRHGGKNITISLGTPGQLSLWRKLGLSGILESRIPGTNLSIEEVVRFLYLGKSNIEPGELAIMGRSLPGRGDEFSEMDIVFYLTDFRGNPHYRAVEDGLIGLDPRALKKGNFGAIRVPNVGGIIIFPDAWSVDQMKDYAKRTEVDFVRRNGGPPSNILYLTRQLFDYWKERGSAFSLEGDKDYRQLTEGFQDLRRKVEYGYGLGTSTKYFLGIWRPGAEIGGSKGAIVEVEGKEDENRAFIFIDCGSSFNTQPAFRDITARATTANGLARDLEYGGLPMIRGALDFRYLVQTAKNYPEVFSESTTNPVAIFVGAEIVHRLRSGLVAFEDLCKMFGRKNAGEEVKLTSEEEALIDEMQGDEDEYENVADVMSQAEERKGREMVEKLLRARGQNEINLYRGGDSVGRAVIATHGHVDHIGMMPFLDAGLPVYARTPTIAHMLAMTARAVVWRDKIAYVSDLFNKKGAAYPRIYRELVPIHRSEDYVRLGQNITFNMPLVDHSIDGAAMVHLRLGPKGESGGIVFTGDFRMGEYTQKAVEMLRGRANTIVIESTHGEGWDPWLAGITENVVGGELREIFKNHPDNMIIIVCPHNNLARLKVVFDAAHMAGRRIAMGAKHAAVIDQMRATKIESPIGAEGFINFGSDYDDRERVGLPKIGTDFALWTPAKTKPIPYENVLRSNARKHENGTVSAWDLSEDPRKLVVVIDPAAQVDNIFAGIGAKYRPTIVYSAYFPYEQRQKWSVGQMRQWAESRSGEFIAPFDIYGRGGRAGFNNRQWRIHASGHASLEDSVNEVLIPLGEGNWRDLNIVIVHGEHPERTKTAVEELIKKRLGRFPKGTRVMSNFAVYNPKDPFKFPGFFLKL